MEDPGYIRLPRHLRVFFRMKDTAWSSQCRLCSGGSFCIRIVVFLSLKLTKLLSASEVKRPRSADAVRVGSIDTNDRRFIFSVRISV